MTVNALLTIENLGKEFRIHALNKTISACSGISISVNEGEFVGITGRSGSGKSTILKMIYRTYVPYTGEVWYQSEAFGKINLCTADERVILRLRKHEIGYISQFLGVIPRTTARQVLEQSVVESGGNPEEAREQAQTMLSHFELDPSLWDSYVNTFSGGEKLRLNIARAMVRKPRLLLLDEPTASLDQHAKLRVRELLQQLKNTGTTMLGIFHDLEFMEGLCDREYHLQGQKMAVSGSAV